MASPEAASELVSVPVAPAVESTLSLASGIGLPPATVVGEMEPGVTVLGNPVWLGQITLNLVSNALLAMAPLSAEARRLTLRTRTSGELVLIECSDSGGGVSATIRDRLFEPFVSTRLQGSGSGLGLYVCRELAGRMGGSLELTQTGPAGTTFTLRLPRFVSIGADVPAPPPVRPSPRRGRVLVVDDEPLIGEVARSHLREHDVHVVATNESALAAFVQHDWDVVVLDIVLAGEAGGDLWTKIQTLAPSAAERVVFVSGGSMTPDVARFLVETHHPTLVKPFDFRELAQLVNDHVARRGAQFA